MNQAQTTFLIWIGIFIGGWFLLNQFYGKLSSEGGRLKIIERGVPGSVLFLHWEGPVQPPMYKKIRAAFRKYKDKKSRVILSISSRGGLVSYGGRVVKLLRKIRQTHPLETLVMNGKVCASMCVPIYLQGQSRIAGSKSRFMFHEVQGFDPLSDRRVYTPASQKEAGTNQLFSRYFQPAGVSEDWMKAARPKMRGKDYWATGQELVDSRSNIVHRVEDYRYTGLVR